MAKWLFFIKLSASTLVKIWFKSHANFVKSLWWGNYIRPWPTPTWSTPHQFWKISTMENRPLPTFFGYAHHNRQHSTSTSPWREFSQVTTRNAQIQRSKEQTWANCVREVYVENQKKMVKCLNWVNRPVSLVVIHTNRQIATCFANFGGKFPSVTWSYHHPMKVGEGFRSKSSIAEQHWKPTAKWKQERPTCGCARGWLTARRWWGKNLDVPKRVREIFSKWIKNPNILTITSRWNNPFTKHWS